MPRIHTDLAVVNTSAHMLKPSGQVGRQLRYAYWDPWLLQDRAERSLCQMTSERNYHLSQEASFKPDGLLPILSDDVSIQPPSFIHLKHIFYVESPSLLSLLLFNQKRKMLTG